MDNRIIGRNKEVLRLENWYKGDEPLICVTGMGGIGKSTVVRKFISVNEELFENVVYLNYRDSLQETLIDDDLFAGIGGIRCGLELAAKEKGLKPVCVFTSEIKPYAVKVLQENHHQQTPYSNSYEPVLEEGVRQDCRIPLLAYGLD